MSARCLWDSDLARLLHENHEGTQGTKKNLSYGEESKNSLSKLSHVVVSVTLFVASTS